MRAYIGRCFLNAVPAALRNLQGIRFRFELSVIVFSPSRFASSSFVRVYTTCKWWARCAGSLLGTIYRFELSVARHSCVKIAKAGILALQICQRMEDVPPPLSSIHAVADDLWWRIASLVHACIAGMVIRRCAPASDTS